MVTGIETTKKMCLIVVVLQVCVASVLNAAGWRTRIEDWKSKPRLEIGDWGFDRPGYPKGLYIHGITVKKGKPVKNPVIYDNDVYDDVFDDEWMYAMASLGRMNLAGLIVTPVLTDFWTFSHPDWVNTAYESRENAILSGIDARKIPEITIGTEAESEKAAEGKASKGAEMYVRIINEQYEKHPECPVIVNIGGQGATLASAYCIDPGIAEKCIVYYTDIKVYNGHCQWASKLIAANFRVVSWGDDNWWIQKKCQNEWNVLPRPDKCHASDNDENSGEWELLTAMKKPMLSHMVKQFRTRGEYSNDGKCGDAYGDGTFIHAWLPSIFSDAELMTIRGGEVLHITQFGSENEAEVKNFTMETLLNPQVYKHK